MSFVDHDTGRDRRNEIAAVRQVTPHLVRVTIAGDTLDDFVDNGTDQHVAILFFDDDVIVPDPFDSAASEGMRPFVRPRMRRYTVRRFDAETRTLDFDAVLHADGGPGADWAASARIGDPVYWWGPTSAWHPDPDTRHVIAVGDETALPAIEAIIREAPDGLRISVVAEVPGPEDEAYLDEVADRAEIAWVHRSTLLGEVNPAFLEAMRAVRFGDGPVQVWGAAEYSTVQAMRRWFHGECGLDRQAAYLVTYWTHGQPQDERPERRDAHETNRNRQRFPERAREFLRDL